MDLTEHPVHESELFKGGFLHARRDRVRLPDGSLTEREYILHPGAVMIIPLLERAGGTLEVVLERQYRYPVQRTLIEFPAGKLDPGESALACAQRELREETGYVARQWARAGVLHPVVSYSTEVIEIWFARHLVSGKRALDAGEFLEVFSATPAQLQAWCRGGEVTDAKTLVGALWLQNVLGGAWPLTWQDVPAT
ncbi:NUDIX domain-containing protein [Ottowia pentelensis]|uniref:GDP-mannose pyrophosphatase n=1 Tax=Ottowia pentelensis TaxID=511108 RepID=A0ABV6PXH0_9BURK